MAGNPVVQELFEGAIGILRRGYRDSRLPSILQSQSGRYRLDLIMAADCSNREYSRDSNVTRVRSRN